MKIMSLIRDFIPEPLVRFSSSSSALFAKTEKASTHFSLQNTPPDFTMRHSLQRGLPHCLQRVTDGLPV